jgi:hypothetical protein
MRRFSSYGPINTKLHYYAPREELINRAYTNLVGENPAEGGHYITVWAPRQTGKTWLMQQIFFRLQNEKQFNVIKINLESLKDQEEVGEIISSIAEEIGEKLGKTFTDIHSQKKFQGIFKKGILDKPLILILDEFDSLAEKAINAVVSSFRNIYINRIDDINKPTQEKFYLLHGVALIGVRSVLGVENVKGSPFNVQRSLHVPNLTYDEVKKMFHWYERESGQKVQEEVIDGIFYETNGQPGLTSWLGELLTEGFDGYIPEKVRPITKEDFEKVFAAATYDLPNSNILNIISKAKQEPYKQSVLELFRTDIKLSFKFDDPDTNFLYMNGVVDREIVDTNERYIKFACPFVQKRLFNYFSSELSRYIGRLYEPLLDLENVINDEQIHIKNVIGLYQQYLKKNAGWLFKDAPKRDDLRIQEAVYHFNLYAYLNEFLRGFGGKVFPEFPTGNGKVDLIIRYRDKLYAIEVKSFTNLYLYRQALTKAAQYAKKLGIPVISLVFFIDTFDEKNREKYEVEYSDQSTGVKVIPIFIETDK